MVECNQTYLSDYIQPILPISLLVSDLDRLTRH